MVVFVLFVDQIMSYWQHATFSACSAQNTFSRSGSGYGMIVHWISLCFAFQFIARFGFCSGLFRCGRSRWNRSGHCWGVWCRLLHHPHHHPKTCQVSPRNPRTLCRWSVSRCTSLLSFLKSIHWRLPLRVSWGLGFCGGRWKILINSWAKYY